MKITLIGAGGVIFAQKFLKDIMLDPSLREADVCMMDISEERLSNSFKYAQMTAEKLGVKPNFTMTTDLVEAVRNADYVITVFRCGTLDCQKIEYEIPAKYGVDQVVADTAGPGGIFRGLRVIKALLPIVDAMEKYCPGAYLLNYVNPMPINTIAASMRAKTVKVIGLCHSVQGTLRSIADKVGVPFQELRTLTAGINHQAFFLKAEYQGKDIYPALFKAMENPEIYNKDKVRFEIMRHFGYFPTESSGHGSEYIPYFRKRKELIEKFCNVEKGVSFCDGDGIEYAPMFCGVSGAAYHLGKQMQKINDEKIVKMLNGEIAIDTEPSAEYAIQIISAIVNNRPFEANLNVMNHGLIPSLPPECCVEVPCLVSGGGIQPTRIENYPEQLAGLNRPLTGMHIMAAKGAVNASKRDIFHAVALDPLTAAVCSLDEIQAMTDELFEALKDEIDERFFQ